MKGHFNPISEECHLAIAFFILNLVILNLNQIIMKSFFTVFALLLSVYVFAQSPNAINYQGVARDNGGNVLTNQSIGLRISILSGSPTGTIAYSETHAVATNDFGLFNIAIGTGSLVSGSFSSIDWGANDHYTKVEFDPAGGSSYSNLGTSQLLSVPYALYAENSGTGGPTGPTGPSGTDGTQWTTGTGAAPWPADEGDLFYNTSTGDVSQVISESWTVIGNIMGSSGATGPTGATGPLVAGNTKETLRHNGSSWVASDVLTNDGTNVGIGTSTPTEKLEVNGNIGFPSSGRSITAQGAFNVESTTGVDMIIDSDNNSTNSSFRVKRNGDGSETIFEAKENGNIEVEGEYTYASNKTHYKSLSFRNFKAMFPHLYSFGQTNFSIPHGEFPDGTVGIFGYATAPLSFPDGAVIKGMRAWIWDNDATKPVRVRLYWQQHGNPTLVSNLATIESDNATALASVQELSTTTSVGVNNEEYSFFLVFEGQQASSDTRLYAVTVEYTVNQAD